MIKLFFIAIYYLRTIHDEAEYSDFWDCFIKGVNYILIFWLTDILFYKLIFKMKEIRLLQCQSIESYGLFKRMI